MADEVVEKVIEAPDPTTDRDEVNDAVREAISSLKGDAVETPAETEQPVETPEAPVADRARGPDGKFIPKEAAPEVAAAPDLKLPPPEAAKPSVEQPSTAVAAAPVSWAAEAKAAWASLPPAIQQAVIKREAEASAGFAQYSEKTKRYEQALAPIAQESQRRGLSTEDGIQRLMDGQRFLETRPAEAIMWLAKTHGIDLTELASNPPAPQPRPQADPAFVHVNQTVSSLEQRLASIEFGQNLTLTQQFARDQNRPYYADVEEQLPEIINELKAVHPNLSPAELLEKSYERAVWLNPDVRAKIIAAQHTQTEQAKVAKVQEKSAQAARAAVSVKGSSASAAPPPRRESKDGTAYDDVRAAIQQLRAS